MSATQSIQLDALRTVETPEGVALNLRVVGPVPRALAWFLDALIRAAMMFAVAWLLSMLGQTGVGLMLIGFFVIEWFYPVLFEVLKDGSTPGKKAFGIKVVNDDGTPVGWAPSLLRNLLRGADFFPVAYATGLVTMLCNREFKRLGDLAAATIVIYRDSEYSAQAIPEGPVRRPAIELTTAEQRAVIDFAQRRQSMSGARQQELAAIVAPLLTTVESDPVEAVVSVARSCAGQEPSQSIATAS